jgi:hypothetical protein
MNKNDGFGRTFVELLDMNLPILYFQDWHVSM